MGQQKCLSLFASWQKSSKILHRRRSATFRPVCEVFLKRGLRWWHGPTCFPEGVGFWPLSGPSLADFLPIFSLIFGLFSGQFPSKLLSYSFAQKSLFPVVVFYFEWYHAVLGKKVPLKVGKSSVGLRNESKISSNMQLRNQDLKSSVTPKPIAPQKSFIHKIKVHSLAGFSGIKAIKLSLFIPRNIEKKHSSILSTALP